MIMFVFSHRITVVVIMVSLINIVQRQNGGLIKVVISRSTWSVSASLHKDCKTMWKILLHLEAGRLQELCTG